VLSLGAIPVVEEQAGYAAVFAGLPVLAVADFALVTPALLEREYERIMRDADKGAFDLTKLTSRYWQDQVMRAARPSAGCEFEHVEECLPPKSVYPCWRCT
jgi:hypothetical protein